MSVASTVQVQILESISRGKGDLLNYRYLTPGELEPVFGEDVLHQIEILMDHGLVKRVGWKNRVKAVFLSIPLSEIDQIRVSTLGLMYMEKFYKKHTYVQPPLERKYRFEASVVTPLVMI